MSPALLTAIDVTPRGCAWNVCAAIARSMSTSRTLPSAVPV